ncbi:MAG: hypothetical protein MMC33_006104 [Icmadophila ericetorum]|nr:hypothetical protein [Icmadophila ericetorum]
MLDDSEFQDVKAWLEESDKDRTQATQVDMPFTGPARKEADCKQKLSNEFIILKNEYTRKSDECDQLRRFQAQPHIEKTQAANDERELSDIPDALQDSNNFVLVLIDGDGYKAHSLFPAYQLFQDSLVKDGHHGGIRAARLLLDSIRQYIESFNATTKHWFIMVQIYGGLRKLAEDLEEAGIIEHRNHFLSFTSTFTRAQPLLDFIDIGCGKERAGQKIKEMFRLFVRNRQCKQITFGGCHNPDYVSLLGPHDKQDSKITLLEAAVFAQSFRALGFRCYKFPSVFQSELTSLHHSSIFEHPTNLLHRGSIQDPGQEQQQNSAERRGTEELHQAKTLQSKTLQPKNSQANPSLPPNIKHHQGQRQCPIIPSPEQSGPGQPSSSKLSGPIQQGPRQPPENPKLPDRTPQNPMQKTSPQQISNDQPGVSRRLAPIVPRGPTGQRSNTPRPDGVKVILSKDWQERDRAALAARDLRAICNGCIIVNRENQRIDPVLPKCDKIMPRLSTGWSKPCHWHLLVGNCKSAQCMYSHKALTFDQELFLRQDLRDIVCPKGSACRLFHCHFGHHCSFPCTRGEGCTFADRHGIDGAETKRYLKPEPITTHYFGEPSYRNRSEAGTLTASSSGLSKSNTWHTAAWEELTAPETPLMNRSNVSSLPVDDRTPGQTEDSLIDFSP